ncbi:RIO kinase 1 [Spraguea lophii 42_110]|uniref:non-specific serine/threonine protein kinase n=1 Tax=Spraguea lophii (strain 42_110) TaxID=1358809 RepID=S7XH19_SPRLO|nr:RIO kinase 1 [Spraguea lophii 42_110]
MENNKVQKRIKDKKDRATVDKVLDPKTMNILRKLENRNLLFNLGGCISSGKEANIYTGKASTKLQSKFFKETGEEEHIIPVVIKIYRTSKLEFKSREKYIEGERRFQSYCMSNPRKLIKLWAEKEVRNLKRINECGILSPKPIYLKNNILIMELIGEVGKVAPRLKDLKDQNNDDLYKDSIRILKKLYRKAKLVHSDFSEYNLLFFNQLYLIDLGQAIETSQENSDAFLIMDIYNINNFFMKKGVQVKNINDLYEEITQKKIPSDLKNIEINSYSFIPQNINEVKDTKDMFMFTKNNEEESDVSGFITESSDSVDICNELDKITLRKTKSKIASTKEEIKMLRKEFKDKRKEKRMSRNKMTDKNKKLKKISRKKKRTQH